MQPLQTTDTLHLQRYIHHIFDDVVDTIVNVLDFRAAMFAVYERVNDEERITVRAFSVQVLRNRLIKDMLLGFGELISGQKLIGNYVVINDPETQKVNQAVQAITRNLPYHITHHLYDLFAPRVNPTIARIIQGRAGVRSILTVPFRNSNNQLLGNLYAASDEDEIPTDRISQLRSFTQMATLAIEASNLALQNARYAQNAERMAMLASGVGNNTHRLNNLLGSVGSALFMEIIGILTRMKSAYDPLAESATRDQVMQLSQDIWTKELDALDETTLRQIGVAFSELSQEAQQAIVATPDVALAFLARVTQQVRSASQLLQNIATEVRQYAQTTQQDIVASEEPDVSQADIAHAIEFVCHSLLDTQTEATFLSSDGYRVPDGVQLAYPSYQAPVWVKADSKHLQELIYIITKNACQACSAQGQVRFTLEESAEEVHLHIQDNGSGIPPAQRKRLFELKESGKVGGLGYGLWYAALTVQKYGGQLRFTTATADEVSQANAQGTTFTITLKKPMEGS